MSIAKHGGTPAGSPAYLLAGQALELERLQLQSRVWEPSGRRLLEEIGDGRGARALDVGCGALGWLRVLSEWVGPEGEVTGADIDGAMLTAADRFATQEGLRSVALVKDDLFASELEPGSFDLVHARYEICPLGRAHQQVATYVRLARSGGTIVLEDPDPGSWHFNPTAPALERLIELIRMRFARAEEIGRQGETPAPAARVRHRRQCPGRGPGTSPWAPLPAPASAIRRGTGEAAAVLDQSRGARCASCPGRGGASGARPLGHPVHAAAVLGQPPTTKSTR